MSDTTRAAGPIHLSDANFTTFIAQADLPVLVDVYADWCGPCRLISPIVEQLATDLAGKVIVAKLDADASPRTVMMLGIRGIPTVVAFHRGHEIDRQVGLASRQRLVSMVDIAPKAAQRAG